MEYTYIFLLPHALNMYFVCFTLTQFYETLPTGEMGFVISEAEVLWNDC